MQKICDVAALQRDNLGQCATHRSNKNSSA